MGAVYKFRWGRKGRYIYNRERLHKCGFEPKHKLKHRLKMQEMKKEIEKVVYLNQ